MFNFVVCEEYMKISLCVTHSLPYNYSGWGSAGLGVVFTNYIHEGSQEWVHHVYQLLHGSAWVLLWIL